MDRIQRFGPLPFSEVMDVALYHDELGFYTTSGAAGRRGDFITSVEIGPLFGALIAGRLDAWWDGLGRPDPFVVIEAGAGIGTLARSVLLAAPRCQGAMTYVLVERSAALRARHARGLPLVPSAHGLPPALTDEDGVAATVLEGGGPRVVSLERMPRSPMSGVVLANELLDNLPFRVVERGELEWREIAIGLDEHKSFTEISVPCEPAVASVLDRLAPVVPTGARVPWQSVATDWLRDVIGAMTRGHAVAFDYGASTSDLARRGGWLRTYRDHARGSSPLEHLGQQDITADVALDQLAEVRAPDVHTTQRSWLDDAGIDHLVEEGRRIWHERSAIGDIAAMRARSRVREAEALLDPGGLGGFTVLEWTI
jgi:SAM-dependent MidA family methyltransferase